jgi:branched-chain amino acid transport system substrate-binding protein
MMRRTTFMVVLAALAAARPALADGKAITLGAAVQMTGALANTGRYYRDAYQLTVERINSHGGVTVAGEKHPLAVKLYDSQSDVNLGVRQYVQLVSQDKVNFLLGPFSSNDALDDSSVAEKYQVPLVQGGGASSQIFSRGYKYVFGTLPPADDYFASTLRMLQKLSPPPKRVALVSADDSFDVSVAKGTRKLLADAKLDVVVDKQYTEHSSEFSSILSLVKSKEPDVLLWSGHESQALNFIRQMKGLGVSPKLMASFTVGVPTEDFRRALGKDAEYAFGMTPWLPEPALKDDWFGDAEQFAKVYQDRFGYAPDYHAASAAADVETFAKALEAAGSLDPSKVRDAIARVDFQCLYGRVHFGQNGQISLAQTVIQIQDGKVVPVFAEDFIGKPRYPVPPWSKR